MTYRTAFIDPDFSRKPRPNLTGIMCYRCGKPIKEGSKYRVVHVDANDYLGMVAVHPEDEHLAPQSDDWMPVGMDCAKKIGMEFTHAPEAWSHEVRSKARGAA